MQTAPVLTYATYLTKKQSSESHRRWILRSSLGSYVTCLGHHVIHSCVTLGLDLQTHAPVCLPLKFLLQPHHLPIYIPPYVEGKSSPVKPNHLFSSSHSSNFKPGRCQATQLHFTSLLILEQDLTLHPTQLHFQLLPESPPTFLLQNP